MFLVQYVAHHVILLLSNMHNRYCVWFMFFWYAFNEDFPHQMHLAIIPDFLQWWYIAGANKSIWKVKKASRGDYTDSNPQFVAAILRCQISISFFFFVLILVQTTCKLQILSSLDCWYFNVNGSGPKGQLSKSPLCQCQKFGHRAGIHSLCLCANILGVHCANYCSVSGSILCLDTVSQCTSIVPVKPILY
jgi:hypothetical protein